MQGLVTTTGSIALVNEGLGGPTWKNAQVGLIVDNGPQSPYDTLAAHIEASYPGYARIPVTWGPVFWDAVDGGPDWIGVQNPTFFGPAGGVGGQTVTGWVIVSGGGSGSGASGAAAGTLLAVGVLDAPAALTSSITALPLDIDMGAAFDATATTKT